MIARVVTKRDDARLAIGASTVSAAGLALVVLDDLMNLGWLRPDLGVYGFVASLIALAGIGPWLAWTRRGRTMSVTCAPGVVRAGALTINAADVTALQIATGARGRSVAIARGPSVVFLEVERADDAARIVAALGVPVVPFGDLGVRPVASRLAVVQAILAVIAIVFAPLYYASAAHGFRPFGGVEWKAVFGIGGVMASVFGFGLLAARRLLPGQAVALRKSTWDAHVALHRVHAADAEMDAVRSDDEKRAKAADREEADARAEPIRVANLGRGDEPIGAWLARLDAIPREQHAYRGDAMKKDVLWDALGDDGAPVDTRMAAARVLGRRYGEAKSALVRVVGDREVRVRVEAALEEPEEAEEHLERLGPLFRAR